MVTRENSSPTPDEERPMRNLPTIPADHRLFYGPDPAQFGTYISRSSRGLNPVIMLFHGGSWRAH